MKYKLRILAASIGIVYLLFGGLKFLPTLSPAEDIGIETVQILTCNLIPPSVSIILLAVFEVGIGLLLLLNKCQKIAISLAVCHIILTFTPVIFFPEQIIDTTTYGPSLLGQYIFKNIVLLSALALLYPTKEAQTILTY